jgi:catechol 2,3-dioxygenase-like lactoylglutathione lyase family enzyme
LVSKLAHLSLAVADQQSSRRFYETFFGFDCDGELDGAGCFRPSFGRLRGRASRPCRDA